jgi:stage III sporulation protein AH
MDYIEEMLGKNYKNVIVTEDSGKWKVSVQADKLEKSEAVSIVDLVMTELGATQDKIVVERVK